MKRLQLLFLCFGLVCCSPKKENDQQEVAEKRPPAQTQNSRPEKSKSPDTLATGASAHCSSNEVLVFGFALTNGKIASICKEKNGAYLVYRFGTRNKIELEYPQQLDRTSWKKFSFYMAECPATNELDDHLTSKLIFTNNKARYEIFEIRENALDLIHVGIMVTENGKTTVLKGAPNSITGWLNSLQENKDDLNSFEDRCQERTLVTNYKILPQSYVEYDFDADDCWKLVKNRRPRKGSQSEITADQVTEGVYPIVRSTNFRLENFVNQAIRKTIFVSDLKYPTNPIDYDSLECFDQAPNSSYFSYTENFTGETLLSITINQGGSSGVGSGSGHLHDPLTFDLVNYKILNLEDVIRKDKKKLLYTITKNLVEERNWNIGFNGGFCDQEEDPDCYFYKHFESSVLKNGFAVNKKMIIFYLGVSYGGRSAAEPVIFEFDKYPDLLRPEFKNQLK